MPWQPLALAGLLIASYAAQLWYGGGRVEPGAEALGLIPSELFTTRGSGLFTYIFLHAGLTHVGIAILTTLVLATPLARRMPGWTGLAGLVSFFVICGGLGGLAFALLSPTRTDILIGSSAAISGLLAAAVRTAGMRRGVGPLFHPLLLAIGGVWLVANGVAAVTDMLGPSVFSQYGWPAHVAGFVVGALLVEPWVKLFGPAAERFDSSTDMSDPES